MTHSSRGWGKTQQARSAYEAAKADGQHAHWWGHSGTECSVNCSAARRADVPGKESSQKG